MAIEAALSLAHETDGLSYQESLESELCMRFIVWMRSNSGTGWFAAIEVDEHLEAFCELIGVDPPPRARARQMILSVPGVLKKRQRLSGPGLSRIARVIGTDRATCYWIPPSTPVPFPAQSLTGSVPVVPRAVAGH